MDDNYIGKWMYDSIKPTDEELFLTLDAVSEFPEEFDFTLEQVYQVALNRFNLNSVYLDSVWITNLAHEMYSL